MNVKNIKGLKYPDEYIIKYFFKEKLFNSKGKVIEFGCSNGNNLALFSQYNYDVIGIDISNQAVSDANYNFQNIYENTGNFTFYCDDMLAFANNNKNLEVDVFLLPNIINYIKKEDLVVFLKTMIQNNNIKKDASIFVRCRTPKDFRFGIGEKLECNTYKLSEEFDITGEASCINRFYSEFELVDLLKKTLDLKDFITLSCECQNPQSENTIVLNSDMVLWGKIN
ncbi:class I SAM-dependent methyltransferase [Arcobacter roscoffensis]|uniref:Class I SAM-dependent methyltransferase n=1 Tax=Arcobacter roscoffensis TaxID=2961520 RepID=A0ABY5E491_9BACT|nr:class I SAM-dependent methyltransferase [Arcobacter roscoffensis]UTJ06369.1 class I SAM-dependent methyltransferase [Arcobacter roscoffensis]